MTVQRQIDRLVTQRASEWFEALKTGREEDYPDFARWISESPRHMTEFLAIVALNEELPAAFTRAGIDRDALLKRVSAPVTPLRTGTERVARPSLRARRWQVALAATVAGAVLGVAVWRLVADRGTEFSTDLGEQRTVALHDGSLLYLNAATSLRIGFDSQSRNIRLEHGEALFDVAQDRKRPFRVLTRNARVEAVGTQFNVDTRARATVISVLSGRVKVTAEGLAQGAPEVLDAGHAAEVSRGSALTHRTGADVTGAIAWRQRRLVFSRTPLEEVVEDFNRFHRTGRLVLEGIAPGSHHYTGTFDADDVASFAQILRREKDLSVEVRGGDYIVGPD